MKDEASGGQGLTALPFANRGRDCLNRVTNKTPSDANETFASTKDVLAAFATDSKPFADAIKELLKDPSREACEKLPSDLLSLLPDDPALAAILAVEMAKEFG